MGVRWEGIEERPLDGVVRLRSTSVSIHGLCTVSIIACSIMVVLGTSPLLFILAWLPLIAYLYLSGVWARALPGYTVWRSFTVDRVWARFWLDEGNLELEIETRLKLDLVPYRKECLWSYVTHYLLPDGIEVGVMRFHNDWLTERVMLLVEGINEDNWDLAHDILAVLDGVDISMVTIHGNPVAAPTPWGYTTHS